MVRKQLLGLMIAVICVSAFAIFHHVHANKKWGEPYENQSIEHKTGHPHRYQAPDFSLRTMDGKEISIKDFRGRYVLLNMWASWCGPCQKEAPELVRLNKKFAPHLTVIGVNMTSQELSLQDVKKFVKHYGVDFPVLLDSKGRVMNSYGVKVLPTSFVIGKNGFVLRQFRGPVSVDELVKTIKKTKGISNTAR
ncbi:MAG TPA: TlpA disulfide reductase family protein [Bacillales bacterium]|nr:TlpA disulfide reductase family protein [Bacillales bacterium]